MWLMLASSFLMIDIEIHLWLWAIVLEAQWSSQRIKFYDSLNRTGLLQNCQDDWLKAAPTTKKHYKKSQSNPPTNPNKKDPAKQEAKSQWNVGLKVSDWEKKVEEQVKFAVTFHIFGTTKKAKKATIRVRTSQLCVLFFKNEKMVSVWGKVLVCTMRNLAERHVVYDKTR